MRENFAVYNAKPNGYLSSPMTFRYPCPDCGHRIEVDYDPPCPPIACSDHDHPAFSDPGDPGGVDCPSECDQCKCPVDEDDVEQFCRDELEARYEAAAEARYESQRDDY